VPYAKTGDGLSEPGRGAGDNASPSYFGRSGNPIKFRGQIMTTTLLLVPPPRNFRPSYSLGKKENLDKIPNGNTLLALACLDLVKTFIAMLLRFVILANSKQA
jgi:hypothetical protein